MSDAPAAVQAPSQGNGSPGAAQEDEFVELPGAEPISALDAKSVLEALHQLRVLYIRGSKRAGRNMPASFVRQVLGSTLSLIDFAEQKRVPYPQSIVGQMAAAKVSPSVDAEKLADNMESSKGPNSYLDYPVQVLVVGKPRVGKSELINSLLGKRAIRTHPMDPPNSRERVVKGRVHGMPFNFIELPGVRYEEDAAAVQRAMTKHKPHVVLFVERADVGGPSDYDASLVTQLFGEGAVDAGRVVLVLTHAGEYMPEALLVEEWNELLEGVLEGSPGGWCVAECHPDCPKTPEGEAMVVVSTTTPESAEQAEEAREEGGAAALPEVFDLYKELRVVDQPSLLAIPWKAALLLQMLQVSALMVLGSVVQLSRKMRREDGKVAIRQLPPVEYYIEDMLDDCDEMPDPWDHKTVMECMEDPYDFLNPYSKHLLTKDMKRLRDDEEDWAWGYEVHKRLFGPDPLYEDFDPAFNHVYLNVLRKAARDGNPLARREYDRYKLRYNSEIVDQLIFVEPELWEMDYEMARMLQSMPLQDYVELRSKIGRVDNSEIVEILDRHAPAKYDYRRWLDKLSKPPSALDTATAAADSSAAATTAAAAAAAPPPSALKPAAATGAAAAAAKPAGKKVRFADDSEADESEEDEEDEDEEDEDEEGTEQDVEALMGVDADDQAQEQEFADMEGGGGDEEDEGGPAMDEDGFMTGMKVGPEIDFGEHFDIPSHSLGYRFRSYIGDEGDRLPFTINMSQDYFRYERDNGIMGTGLSLEFNHDMALAKSLSIQGLPVGGKLDVDFAKNGGNVSGLLHASMMHSAPPLGPKHVSELYLNFQKLMSLSSDALYTLELHTYRKSLWGWTPAVNCPPSLGFIVTRMAEGGNPLKGPCGVGMRGQAHVRVGAFDTLLVGGRMACYAPKGAIDEGWSLTVDVIQPFLQDLDLDVTFYGFHKDASAARRLGLAEPPKARSFGCQARTTWRWDFADVVSNWNAYWQLGRDVVLIQAAMESTNPMWALLGLVPALVYVGRNTSYWADLLGRIPGLFGRLLPARSDRAARERRRLELERKREQEAQQRQQALQQQEQAGAAAGAAEAGGFPEVTEEDELDMAKDPRKQERAFDLLQKYLTKVQAEVDRRAAEAARTAPSTAAAAGPSALEEEILPGFQLKDKLGWRAARGESSRAAARAAAEEEEEETEEEEEEEEVEDEDEAFEEVDLEELEGTEEDPDGSWQHTGDERDSAEEAAEEEQE